MSPPIILVYPQCTVTLLNVRPEESASYRSKGGGHILSLRAGHFSPQLPGCPTASPCHLPTAKASFIALLLV